jgi:hypothetical protein
MLAEMWENPYSEVCGYVNGRMSNAESPFLGVENAASEKSTMVPHK